MTHSIVHLDADARQEFASSNAEQALTGEQYDKMKEGTPFRPEFFTSGMSVEEIEKSMSDVRDDGYADPVENPGEYSTQNARDFIDPTTDAADDYEEAADDFVPRTADKVDPKPDVDGILQKAALTLGLVGGGLVALNAFFGGLAEGLTS